MDSHVLLSLNRNTMVRHRFTPSEDEKIIQYVEKYGKCWKKIADKFGYLNGRQVRERYLLYLQPGIKNTAWDKSLDLKLLKLAEEYNHKWVKIAQFFPGNGNEISFAAWYPWPENAEEKGYDYSSGNDGTVVSFPIDGKTDILYSTPVSGSANNNFGVMEFNHALCLYNIYVYAMVYEDADGNDDMISNAWGALQDMKIVDMPERCEIIDV